MAPPPTVFRPPQPLGGDKAPRKKSPPPPNSMNSSSKTDEKNKSRSITPPRPVKHWPTPPPLPPAATHWPATAVQQPHATSSRTPYESESERKWHKAVKSSAGGMSPSEIEQLLSTGSSTASSAIEGTSQAQTLRTSQAQTLPASGSSESSSARSKDSFKPIPPPQGGSSRPKQSSTARPRKQVGWNENLFVVSKTGSSGEEEQTTKRLPDRKYTLIDDKAKRDTRFTWSRGLISKAFEPYSLMLCRQDDLLPDGEDEFHWAQDEAAAMDEEFSQVRDAMLGDAKLSEREVAAFFEGFALFHVKVRSLESQLESARQETVSLDDMSRPRHMRSTMRSLSASHLGGSPLSLSKSGKRASLTKAAKADSGPTSTTNEDDSPRMFGKSLRALSIKKVKQDHGKNETVQRLLQELQDADKKQKKLEKQLQQAGVVIAEDIPYDEAKKQVERIAKRLQEIGSSDVTHPDKEEQAKLREEYFKLEQDMEKYSTALMLTDEYVEEQEEMERRWEEDNAEDNVEALKKMRRHMPVEVRSMSEAQLSSDPSPNGKVLPKATAKKFKRTNVLQLLRINPEDITRMHPSTLENLRVTGLTLTERRALYAHLKDVGPRWKSMQAEKMTERKWVWWKMMKQNFKENLDQYQNHVEKYGPPGNHPYATREDPNAGCPLLGKQCPLKADKMIDYDNDYGHPDEAIYEVSQVRKADAEDPGAKAQREAQELARGKRANERSVTLKKHYKGNVLQVSLANGSCEAMDDIVDRIDAWQRKWIEERVRNGEHNVMDDTKRKELAAFGEALNEVKLAVLPLAERSGMQLTGKKDANADQPDIRSQVELSLCEEVYEAAEDLFVGIEERMVQMRAKEGLMKSTIDQLRELLVELHERNTHTLKELGCQRSAPTRKRKSREEILKEVRAEQVGSEPAAEESHVPPAGAHPGRGDLMAALAGRGTGGPGRGGADAGRGGLMAAIAGRGRGGPGRGGADAGRGNLMAGPGRGGADAGRGGLMAAIAGRGRGEPGRGGADAGRGDLMAALAGRVTGGRGGAGAGRGDILAAIAGRGRGSNESGQAPARASVEEKPEETKAPRGAKAATRNRGDFLAAIGALGPIDGGSDGVAIAARPISATGTSSAPVKRRPAGNTNQNPALQGDLLAAIKSRKVEE